MTTPSPTPPVPAAGNQPSGDPGAQPPSATPAPAPGNEPSKLELTQAEFDARMAAARKEAEAKAAKAQAELDKLREGQLTEQEKQIKEAEKKAREAADAEWGGKLLQKEIRAQLAARGFPPDWAAHVKAESEDGIAAAIEEAQKTYPWFQPSSQPPPGPIQTGGPAGPPAPKTIKRSQSQDPKYYEAHGEEVQKALMGIDGYRIVEG